jgi:hypothetical protein
MAGRRDRRLRRFTIAAAVTAEVADQPRCGQPGFDAARLAAEARWTGPLVVARPRQRIVAPFARDRVVTLEQSTVQRETAADPRAEDHAEHDICAAPGAVGRFRQCKAVGVVRERDRTTEQRFEVTLDRHAVEAHRIRSAQQARGAR